MNPVGGPEPADCHFVFMNMKPQKYLKNRATLSPWQIKGLRRSDFSAAIIIPALAERDNLPATLDSFCVNPPQYLALTLVVIVVNNRADVSADQLADNQETLLWLQSNPYPQLNLVTIDASSPGLEIPLKDGVGLARKIGFDASLQLLDWTADPLMISLDADTIVDTGYLSAIFDHFAKKTKGAAVIPFRHQPISDPEQERAIRHYELYLRSYSFGLKLAGSPYAYHSIGSAFACRAAAYIKAGGMNRRCGGEDFYFLQQLTKTSGIETLCGTVVQPSPRFSNRVPFGTGRAIQGQVKEGEVTFRFVSATGFQILQQWLRLIDRLWDGSAGDIKLAVSAISPELDGFLSELGFAQTWKKMQRNHQSRKQRLTAFHLWFDGLRTRQVLGRIDKDSRLSAQQVVAALLDWGGFEGVEGETEQLHLLEEIQGMA